MCGVLHSICAHSTRDSRPPEPQRKLISSPFKNRKRGQCFGSGKGEMGIWLLREAACVSLDVQNSSHVGTRGQGT